MDMCALCSPLVHGFGARFVDKNAALNCRSWTTTAVPVAVVVAVHVPVAVAVAVNVNVDVDVVVAVACVSFLAVAVGEKPQCVFCYAFIWSYRVPAAHCRHGALRNIDEAVNSQVCVCAVAECECVRT